MTRGLLGALFLVLAVVVLSAASGRAQTPIFATVSGPAAVAPSHTAAYTLNVSGGPGEPVNYSVSWYLSGPELGGGSPQVSSPGKASGIRTTFHLNVTAPAKDQALTLTVKINATAGGATDSTTVERALSVVTPIVLSGTFRNDGSTAAVNVTVRFFVDDAPVGTQTIARINPGGSATATFDYLPVGLSTGAHRVRIEADLDGDGTIDSARGEAFVSDVFYKATPPLSTGLTVLIGIGVFVPVFLVTLAARRRNKP